MSAGMDEKRLHAGVELIRRTGAESVATRYDDEPPTIWIAVAAYPTGHHDVAAGLDPLTAVMRLCEHLVDGGTCTHCGRPTAFENSLNSQPLADVICWYQFDPELSTYRRGCEAEIPRASHTTSPAPTTEETP